MKNSKRAFTLIELLVVIAIIAVLSVVVILSLNPAELLRQSRDSNRISDFATIKSAISLYLIDASAPNLASSSASYGGCYVSTIAGNGTTSARCGVFTNTYATSDVSATAATYRKTDSTGWIPVNFSALSYGSPFGRSRLIRSILQARITPMRQRQPAVIISNLILFWRARNMHQILRTTGEIIQIPTKLGISRG